MYNVAKYYEYLLENQVEMALEFKNKSIPDNIYKYFSFGNDSEKLYNSKLSTVKDNEIFFSDIENFNDPFEFKTAYINIDESDEAGINAAQLREMMNYAAIRIASFTEDGKNIPMWAYYSDSFKGYCIKYKVINKDKFFRVHYIEDRFPSFVTNCIAYNDDVITFLKLASLYTTKYKGWEQEKEIRAVIKRKNFMEEKINASCSVSCEDLGISPVEVVLGCKCSDKNAKKMNTVINELNKSKGLDVKLKQMEIKYNYFDFMLKDI